MEPPIQRKQQILLVMREGSKVYRTIQPQYRTIMQTLNDEYMDINLYTKKVTPNAYYPLNYKDNTMAEVKITINNALLLKLLLQYISIIYREQWIYIDAPTNSEQVIS